MGHIHIQQVNKTFVNRRRMPRKVGDPDQFGEPMRILQDISLEVANGEMVCILGPSGCGKSTLLRLIAGFDRPTSGRILIDDKEITRPSANNIFVFQQSGLLPWFTVWQNVELGVRHITDHTERHAKIQEHIELVELNGFEHHYPYQLSGGMQRRAEIARALVANPDVLIMDEPFNGLDFLTHMKIREEIVNMHELFRKTTLVVTHDIDDAVLMGDRVVVFSARPATLKLNRTLNFPRPRNPHKQPELHEVRDELFFMLGVSYAV